MRFSQLAVLVSVVLCLAVASGNTQQPTDPPAVVPVQKPGQQKDPTPPGANVGGASKAADPDKKTPSPTGYLVQIPPVMMGQPSARVISLKDAILLANGQAIDNRVAEQVVQGAAATYLQARVLWLPNIEVGADYYYHSGVFQNTSTGLINRDTKQSFMYGAGFNAIVGTNDAIFAPRAARNDLQSRIANKEAINHDVSVDVTEAYFRVLEYQNELGALKILVKQADELVREVSAMAEGLVPDVEINRAKVELARRKETVISTEERYRIALADLIRILRLPPGEPLTLAEGEDFKVQIVDPKTPVSELIRMALSRRPELAAQQSAAKAALERLRQEKTRPFMPNVLLRSVSTPTNGTLGVGSFGSGNGSIGDYGGRIDYDLQLLWELQNLGFGNVAKIRLRRSENEIAILELLRTQDQVGADVSQSYASVVSAAERLAIATQAYEEAKINLKKNIEGLPQTKRVGNLLVLIIRPQEVVAAFQAMSQAIVDYQGSLADFNRAQFRLNRALGNPAGPVLDELK